MRPNNERSVVRALLLSVMPLLWLNACGDRTWENVATIETGSGAIRAGDLVQLEPSSFEPAELSGSEFAVEKFTFTGHLLDTASDLDLIGTVTVLSGSGDFRSTETLSSDTTHWAANELQKEITIDFPILPIRAAYSGKGYLHFYLKDLDGNCVSNIVAWPVTFK